MSGVLIRVKDGEMSYPQALEVAKRIEELGKAHWHFNDCGCCVTVHGPDCAYVIGRNGEATFYPQRGCECDD